MEKEWERGISSKPKHLEDTKICYITYAYILSASTFDLEKQERYILKDRMNNLRLSQKMSYDKYRRKIRHLIEHGLIIEEDERILIPDLPNYYFITETETLRVLSNTAQDRVIRLYIIIGTKFKLLNVDFKNKEVSNPCIMTLDELCVKIGMKPNRYSRNIVRDQLLVLKSLGLISFKNTKQLSKRTLQEYETDSSLHFTNVSKKVIKR